MKLSEIASAFRAEYAFQSGMRGAEQTDLTDSLLALWISEGIGLIVRCLHPVTCSLETDMQPGVATILLPVDFGTLISVTVNGARVLDATVEPADPPVLRLGSSILSGGRVSISYSPEIEVFSPSAERRQNWGAVVNGALEGDVILPDRFIPLLRKYLLSKVFPDLEVNFDREMIRLKESVATGFCTTMKYHFGV